MKSASTHALPPPLTHLIHHTRNGLTSPPRYWRQRYDLFSLYDSGIHLTNAAWFGVTAEPIAQQIAAELAAKDTTTHRRRSRRPKRKVLIDLFAGAGGNTIAFARQRHWDLVIGIEIDPATLACAQHNAAIYYAAEADDDAYYYNDCNYDESEVQQPLGIVWVLGDCMDFLRRQRDAPDTLAPELRLDGATDEVQLFASPPWGGPMYSGAEVLDLDAMAPYGLGTLHAAMRPWAHALFLPRNGDLNQLADLVADDAKEKLDVVQYCVKGSSKGMVAYYPADPETKV